MGRCLINGLSKATCLCIRWLREERAKMHRRSHDEVLAVKIEQAHGLRVRSVRYDILRQPLDLQCKRFGAPRITQGVAPALHHHRRTSQRLCAQLHGHLQRALCQAGPSRQARIAGSSDLKRLPRWSVKAERCSARSACSGAVGKGAQGITDANGAIGTSREQIMIVRSN